MARATARLILVLSIISLTEIINDHKYNVRFGGTGGGGIERHECHNERQESATRGGAHWPWFLELLVP